MAMKGFAGYVIVALLLAAGALFAFGSGVFERDLAEAQQHLATDRFDVAEDRLADAERYASYARWIPQLGGKQDAVPGYVNKSWFRIPLDAIPEGQTQVVYEGQCAELCGRNHANMYGRVIGMRMADYKKWYAGQVADLKAAQKAVAGQQEALNKQQTGGGG